MQGEVARHFIKEALLKKDKQNLACTKMKGYFAFLKSTEQDAKTRNG